MFVMDERRRANEHEEFVVIQSGALKHANVAKFD